MQAFPQALCVKNTEKKELVPQTVLTQIYLDTVFCPLARADVLQFMCQFSRRPFLYNMEYICNTHGRYFCIKNDLYPIFMKIFDELRELGWIVNSMEYDPYTFYIHEKYFSEF